jgi:5'-phosphate synthase pdxT subunit
VPPVVGVLALQGDFLEHRQALERLGHEVVEVRRPGDLDGLDGLVIPGGESTTIGRLARSHGLVEPIRERARKGVPVFGTCAGMITMASDVVGGEPLLSLMDLRVVRNAYGRQLDSFEADVGVRGLDGPPVRAVFIRAPVVASVGDGVEVLAEHDGHPVVCEQGKLLVAAFHPELAGDARLHHRFLEKVS